MENTRAEGMNRSTTWFRGRMAREIAVPSLRVLRVSGALDMRSSSGRGAGPHDAVPGTGLGVGVTTATIG
ncbi:hypothetical protein GCM10009625_15440 [Brachybacterium fresconis]